MRSLVAAAHATIAKVDPTNQTTRKQTVPDFTLRDDKDRQKKPARVLTPPCRPGRCRGPQRRRPHHLHRDQRHTLQRRSLRRARGPGSGGGGRVRRPGDPHAHGRRAQRRQDGAQPVRAVQAGPDGPAPGHPGRRRHGAEGRGRAAWWWSGGGGPRRGCEFWRRAGEPAGRHHGRAAAVCVSQGRLEGCHAKQGVCFLIGNVVFRPGRSTTPCNTPSSRA